MAKLTREFKFKFRQVFGYEPPDDLEIVAAPGRVNLIGEHLDYNDGWVMPMAISRHTSVLAVPSKENRARVFSEQIQEILEWPINDDNKFPSGSWGNYVRGVFFQLSRKGLLKHSAGFDIYIASDIPMGMGLSSSAAIEVAAAYALSLRSFGALSHPTHFEMAKLARAAEHEFVGVQCGIMDQVASIFSQSGYVMLFDTHFNTIESIPFFDGCLVAIVDSGIGRNLSQSPYNRRREECREALQKIQEYVGLTKARSWRDISPGLLAECRDILPHPLKERACHIVSEIERVARAVEALRSGNKKKFGSLLNNSQESLRNNFEASLPELDSLYCSLLTLPGVYGCRLTGAGWGGCVIALIDEGVLKEFKKDARKAIGSRPIIFTKPSSGVLDSLSKEKPVF